MKVLGLIFVIAIVVMGYCVYNPMVVDSADFTNTQKGKSSSDGCKGPFGFDSQKALTDFPPDVLLVTNNGYGKFSEIKYYIGVVSEIDLEKNDDGTWYVANCSLSNDTRVHFKAPFPQQNELKKGDFIGFKATLVRQTIGDNYYFKGEILEHLSSQSTDCKIDDIRQLTKPTKRIDHPMTEKNWLV